MSEHNLAQLNIGVALAPMDSPTMHGFASRLDEINALAESSDGFIWRLKDDSGNATSIQVFEDPNQLVNMSLWRDMTSLRAFVYRSVHTELLRDRSQWFTHSHQTYQVMWWLPAGELPSLEQAKEKLQMIQTHGPSEQAFDFSNPVEPPK